MAVAPAGVLEFKEGVANTGVDLGQFFSTDVDVGIAFQVSIDWGDGTAIDNQTRTFPSPVFQVTGSHTYTDETVAGKPNVVTVTVTDPKDNTSALVQDAANVVETDLLSPVAFAGCAAIENVAFSGVQVASFTSNNTDALGSDFTATINWGDGVSSAGTVVSAGSASIGGAVAFLV